MLEFQIDNTLRVTRKYLGDRARVIVYLPGYAYRPVNDWNRQKQITCPVREDSSAAATDRHCGSSSTPDATLRPPFL
jgi:hypothetical protein